MEDMIVTETSKVYMNSRAFITSVPLVIRKNMGIDKGDTLEWILDNKTDELKIKVKKADE